MSSLLPILALLAPASAVEGRTPAEVDAFRTTQDRYAARMAEIDGDTRSYMDFREAEEKARVERNFEAPLLELSDSERAQRELSIGRFEHFLAKYPAEVYASHVRFRLAELYFEKSTEKWQAESEAYYARLEDPNLSIEELENFGTPPLRDLSASLALYQKIVDDNVGKPPDQRYERLDGTYLMLGFVYNDQNSVQYDPAKAKATFAELIRAMPDSELADRSHLFLGNFAFADNLFDEALAEYRRVYDKGPDGKYFEEALYQLAWAHYKLNDFDLALKEFTELLDLSEQKKIDTGQESSFAPDARRFMAFSIADIAYDSDDPDAVAVARGYFARVGARPYEREVYRQLADVLVRYARDEESIDTWRALQDDPRWPLESDNPVHQIALINAYLSSSARDLARGGEARLAFIDRYSEGTPWWDANRDDPEALEVARKYIEEQLLNVAIEYRVRAQESGLPEDYLVAAAKYQEYLEKFPISDDYYEQQFFLADSLMNGGKYTEAIVEYESLLRSARYHPYGDAAIYALMNLRINEMSTAGHDAGAPPTDAPVERTYAAGDKEITVYGLTPDRAAFLVAADRVLEHEFRPKEGTDESLLDYQQIVKEKRAPILYLTGQILHFHNRFDESRPRLQKLIDEHHNTIEANYAAGLLVDSYTMEGNLQKVRDLTKTFTLNPPGPPESIDPSRFSNTLEGTTFKLAQEEGESGDPLKAAESFMAFRTEFPRSEFGPDALHNAAYFYQQAGKAEQSSRLYEQFVAENPKDPRSKGLFFRIAANYEAAFELEKAIDYYQRLLTHPDATEKDRADAQYNKSFLEIGLGRHRSAAEGYEEYEARYPNQADREEVYFRAGEQWEKVSSADAIAFYERYKRKYPDTSADRYLAAESRILLLLREQGAESWKLERQNEAILDSFDRFARAGKPIGPMGHEAAAEADFPRLQAEYDKLAKVKLTGNEDRDLAILGGEGVDGTAPKQLKEFEAELDAFTSRYQNFEYNSGAYLLKARAALWYSALGLSLRCPKGFSEDECMAYEDILDAQVFPKFLAVEEVGVKRLLELLDAARQQKRHSRFIDEAQAELNRLRPNIYPAVKRELVGGTDSTMPVELTPLQPAPAPAPAPEGPQ